MPVIITAYADKSFTFIMKTPPATVLIKKAAKVDKGSSKPHTDKVGKLTRAQAEEIAKVKQPDLTAGRSRRRGAHDRRQRPQHGHHGRRSEVIMAEHQGTPACRKRMKTVRTQGRPQQDLFGRRRAEARQGHRRREVRRVGRRRGQPRHRRQEVRPDGARLGRAAVGHRQEGPRRRVRAGRQGQGGQDAGADIVGFDDLAAKIKEGFMEFDVVIASPDAMRVVGQLGQILGPRGLMPNPKVGTVSPDVVQAVKNAKAGQVQYRTDKAGIVQCTIGRASFTPEAAEDEPGRAGRRAEQGQAAGREGRLPEEGQPLQHDGRRCARRHGGLRAAAGAALIREQVTGNRTGNRGAGAKRAGNEFRVLRERRGGNAAADRQRPLERKLKTGGWVGISGLLFPDP